MGCGGSVQGQHHIASDLDDAPDRAPAAIDRAPGQIAPVPAAQPTPRRPVTAAELTAAVPQVQPWDGTRFRLEKKLQDAVRNSGQVVLMVDTWAEAKSGGFARVAVKQMPNYWVQSSSSEFAKTHPEALERPWQDIGSVGKLNDCGYPYACRLLGVFRDSQNTYVATSLCVGGDLFSWCERDPEPGKKRLELICPLVVHIVRAVSWLHDLGIVHGDISLENILLAETRDDDIQVKLIDFGMSDVRRMARGKVCGKQSYQAPEMHTDGTTDGFLTDVFAVGVTVYSLAAKEYPWMATRPGGCKRFDYVRAEGLQRLAEARQLYGRATGAFDRPFMELLEGLLSLDTTKRATLGEESWASEDAARKSAWDYKWIKGGKESKLPGKTQDIA